MQGCAHVGAEGSVDHLVLLDARFFLGTTPRSRSLRSGRRRRRDRGSRPFASGIAALMRRSISLAAIAMTDLPIGLRAPDMARGAQRFNARRVLVVRRPLASGSLAAAAASSRAGRNGRYSRLGCARDNPGARAPPPRTSPPARPRSPPCPATGPRHRRRRSCLCDALLLVAWYRRSPSGS